MVYYRPYQKFRRMPLLLGFGLVALFIWSAENIGTFATVWVYPNQRHGWQLVRSGKYGSWFLLMIISFVLVSLVHSPRLPEITGIRGRDFLGVKALPLVMPLVPQRERAGTLSVLTVR